MARWFQVPLPPGENEGTTTTTTVPPTTQGTQEEEMPAIGSQAYFDAFAAAVAAANASPASSERPDFTNDPGTITGEPWNAGAWGTNQPAPNPYWYSENDPGGQAGDMWDKQFRAGGGGEHQRTPQYSTNDPTRILNNMSSAELAALERQFVMAGVIDEDSIGGTTSRASLIQLFTSLVSAADSNRVSWEQELEGAVSSHQEWLKDHPEGWDKAPYRPFVAPAYLKPDYATLAQKAKYAVRTGLQRDPTSTEMKLLTQFLDDAHRDEWQANEYAVERANWEAGARAYETGEDQTTGTIQGIDDDARFLEYFEERFEGELDHRDRVGQVAANSPGLFASIDKISRSI